MQYVLIHLFSFLFCFFFFLFSFICILSSLFFFQGHWVWAPDATEAFVPAKKLETFYDGRVEVEKEDGTVSGDSSR